MMPILYTVKLALKLTTDKYDTELIMLIASAKSDLGIAGVVLPVPIDPLVSTAIVTYCKLNFLRLDSSEYDQLKRSYDEQKAQMSNATGYTDWGNI